MSEVTQTVIDWVKQNCRKSHPNPEVTESTELLVTKLLDSTDFLDLTSHVEKSYGMKISPDDLSPERSWTLSSVPGLVDRALS